MSPEGFWSSGAWSSLIQRLRSPKSKGTAERRPPLRPRAAFVEDKPQGESFLAKNDAFAIEVGRRLVRMVENGGGVIAEVQIGGTVGHVAAFVEAGIFGRVDSFKRGMGFLQIGDALEDSLHEGAVVGVTWSGHRCRRRGCGSWVAAGASLRVVGGNGGEAARSTNSASAASSAESPASMVTNLSNNKY